MYCKYDLICELIFFFCVGLFIVFVLINNVFVVFLVDVIQKLKFDKKLLISVLLVYVVNKIMFLKMFKDDEFFVLMNMDVKIRINIYLL